jgi:predicted transcriptional regulator
LFEIDDDTDYISLVNELRDKGFSNAQISNTLYYDNQISQRKIAQLLGISRYFVQKYIKSSKNSPKRSVPNGENEISVQDNE